MRLTTGVNLVPKSKKGWVILLFPNLPSWCAQGLFLYLYYCRSFILWKWKACINTTRSQDSSVNTVSRLWAWQLRNCSIPNSGKRLFLYKMSRLALRLTQSPIQWLLEVLSEGRAPVPNPPPSPPYVFMALRGTVLVYFLNKHSHVLLGFTVSLVPKFMLLTFYDSFLFMFCICICVGFWFDNSFIVY